VANPNVYTASYLLASLRRRGMIPTASEESWDEDSLLAMCSEEIQTYIAALMMGAREEWFVKAHDVATVSGTQSYDLPPRSVMSDLRQVLVGSDPNWIVVQRIEPKQAYGAYYGYSNSYTGYATGYYLQDTQLVLISPAASGQTLRMLYFRRPNRVVAESQCGRITAISGNAVTIDSADVPTDFDTSATFDFIKATPGFDTLAMDQTISAINTGTGVMTFVSTPPATLRVGDYVALAGTSPIPQIPVELHPLLAQRVVVKVLEADGDPKLPMAQRALEEQRASALTLLTPRTQGDAQYLINFNGPGFGGRWRKW
jgi:hypothetical protein